MRAILRIGPVGPILLLLAARGAAAETPLEDQALAAMQRATRFFTEKVATHGGYLWKYSADLTERFGEGKATATQVWVQPPGTPSVGLAYVRAYRATGERQFLEAAVAAARALVFGQLWSGGWQYRIDFGPPGRRRLAYRHLPKPKSKKVRRYSVLDDNTTQAALRHLMAVDQLVEDETIHDAVVYGLNALLEAQLPKGGWPQVFGQSPPEQRYTTTVRIEPDGTRTTHKRPTRYWHYYTFNDNAINDCIAVLLEAHHRTDAARFAAALRKAGEFLLASQLPPPQAGWAQQYTWELKPEWARRFEPPAVCSAVTYRNLLTLLDLWQATGEGRYLEPFPAALDWLRRSRLPGDEPRWARFYELGTNRPLYFTKDKYELTYQPDNLPTHYAFIVRGDYFGRAKLRYEEALKRGRDALLAARLRLPSRQDAEARARRLEPAARRIVAALDEQGRWLEDGWIHTRTFIHNLDVLSDFLEARRWARGAVRQVTIPSTKGGDAQPAHLYVPPGAAAGEDGPPVPLVVALHTWSAGHTQTDPWHPILAECRRRRFAAVHPHFRGPNRRPEACASALAVQDVLDAVAFACEQARVDERRILLVGASGGGHMALAMAARAPRLWAGVSAWVPISDLAAWHTQCKAAGRHYWRDIEACCGGPPGPATAAEYHARSPLFHLAAAKGLALDLNAGIHDGHTGSVPPSHTLRAFNVLAEANGHPDQRVPEDAIEAIVRERRVPAALEGERGEALGRRRPVLFHRAAGPARVTLFDGGHEIDVAPALRWLAQQRRP